jgi:hypothetical protein
VNEDIIEELEAKGLEQREGAHGAMAAPGVEARNDVGCEREQGLVEDRLAIAPGEIVENDRKIRLRVEAGLELIEVTWAWTEGMKRSS